MQESPNKPGDSDFKQQRLKGWRLAPNSLILGIIYVSIGIFFLILGIIIIQQTSKVVQIDQRYDDIDQCQANWRTPRTCIVEITIDQYMQKPIYFYYQIHNMYQNHRKYNKSRDISQLMGSEQQQSEIEGYCDPVSTMDDLGFYTSLNLTGSDVANPCGLVARSYFNDTFSMLLPDDDVEIELDQQDIAWSVDVDEKFDRLEDWEEKQWIDVENQHFMVWMNTAGLPTFRKLWAVIDMDLDEGDYRLVIINNYDVSSFNGQKHIVLSTLTAFGGKVEFIGVLYLMVGGVALLGSALMFLTHYLRMRKQQQEGN